MINYANKFGWQAVLGGTPGAGVLRRIVMVENIMNWYKEREGVENWVKWAEDNPEKARVLNTAMRLVHDGK